MKTLSIKDSTMNGIKNIEIYIRLNAVYNKLMIAIENYFHKMSMKIYIRTMLLNQRPKKKKKIDI